MIPRKLYFSCKMATEPGPEFNLGYGFVLTQWYSTESMREKHYLMTGNFWSNQSVEPCKLLETKSLLIAGLGDLEVGLLTACRSEGSRRQHASHAPRELKSAKQR